MKESWRELKIKFPTKHTSYQYYNLSGGIKLAVFDHKRNQFHVFSDDAASLLISLLEGMTIDEIGKNASERFGPEAAAQVIVFFSQWIPALFEDADVTSETIAREDYTGFHITKEGSLENDFLLECGNDKQFAVMTAELTYSCNQNCVHCYNPHHSSAGQLGTKDWKRVISEARQEGLLKLILTGGECSMHPGFWEILSFARSLGISVNVQTNGLTFASPEKMSLLASHYPASYEVSLYSYAPSKHDNITTVPGSFNKTLKSIRLAQEFNIPIAIKAPLMKETWRDALEIKNLADQVGAGLQMDLTLTAKNDGQTDPLAFRIDDDAAIEWLLSQKELPIWAGTYRLSAEVAQPRRLPEGPLCGAGWNGVTIQPDGKVVPCSSLMVQIGDVSRSSMHAVLHGAELAAWRGIQFRDNKACSNCGLEKFCSYCPGISLLESGDVKTSNCHDCRIASIRSNVFAAHNF
jgi:radical SAM protein with 4Fe4S-binding SPASM domain